MSQVPAVLYHPDGYSTAGTRPMGRRVAGEQFLRALAAHATATGAPRLSCYTAEVDMARVFASDVRRAGFKGGLRVVPFGSEGRLAEDGTLYVPDPGLARLAYQRERVGRAAYSLSGVIHTLASTMTLDLVAQLVAAPIMPWDALVCTSRAGRSVVETLLAREEAWLAERFGATAFVRPELPLIPLPVPTQDFAGATLRRAEARRALGISADARVVVFVGRLSLHAKAHPLPLYLALAEVARAAPAVAGSPLVLIECGSYGDPSAATGFAALHAEFPELTFVTVGGTRAATDAERLAALGAGDVFTSLADNVQETFGLSIIEAMAAGLPVVVSDWDGYKDTVRDGVDGFRIPSAFPAAGGAELMRDYDAERLDYDHYVGHLSQLCAVDVGAAAAAFGALLGDPARARAMGAEAEQRAAAEYAGPVIMAKYQALWDELAARRQAQREPLGAREHARRPVPAELYASFPTAITARGAAFETVPGARWELLGCEAVAVVAGPILSAARVTAWRDRLYTNDLAKAHSVVAASDAELAELHVLAKYGLVRRLSAD